MRKPWEEKPGIWNNLESFREIERQIPKYYTAMRVELLDGSMTHEEVLKYLDRFYYDPMIAGFGKKPEEHPIDLYEKDTEHLIEIRI